MRTTRNALLALLFLALPLSAQEASPETNTESAPVAANEGDETFLEAITVTATTTPQSVESTAGSVGVIERRQIEETQAQDSRDLLLFEPGVYVEGSPARLGLGGFNIRGIGGNRVSTRIDGVPVAEQFAFGPLANLRPSIDVDALQSVEILRSAGSSLYGSDALGGLVSLVTRDPADFLNGDSSYLGARLGWNGAAEEANGTATIAGAAGRWSGSLSASYRDGGPAENQGENDAQTSARTTPNPLDRTGSDILGKLVFDANDSWRLRLGMELFSAESEGDVFTSRTLQNLGPVFGPGVTYRIATEEFFAEDSAERNRISAESFGTFSESAVDSLFARLYFYESRNDQNVLELVSTTTGGGPFGPLRTTLAQRDGLFRFDQDGVGAELQGKKTVDGAGRHLLTFGVAYDVTTFDQLRDRLDINPVTGARLPSSNAYPTKYFPESDVEEIGIYVQDEIELASGRLKLVPGLRYDRSELDADQNDPIFLRGNPGTAVPADAEHDAVSPRLGAVFSVVDGWNLFAQYAHGFRTPPYSDVNSGFTNLTSGYTALPNPDLDPETSDNFEIGVRGRVGSAAVALTLFDNRFDDFIELVALGVNPATGLLEYQSRNVGEVRVRGIELAGDARLGNSLALRAAAAWIDGENETVDAPLNSVPPSRIVLGLSWRPEGRFQAGLTTAYVLEKDESDIDTGVVNQFATPDAFIVDLTASYSFTDHIALEAGLFNALDETYWEWGDVQGVTATSAVLDRYTSPGRNFGASLRLGW